jgi:hypothetical protein
LRAKTRAAAALDAEDRVPFIVCVNHVKDAGFKAGIAPGALAFFKDDTAAAARQQRSGQACLSARRVGTAPAHVHTPLTLKPAARPHPDGGLQNGVAFENQPRAGQHARVTADAAVKIAYPEKFHVLLHIIF